MDTTSQLESRVERNCLMGRVIKTTPMLSLTPTIHMERAESSLMRIFKVVSIQRNFFNHTRSAGAPYLNSNVFLSIYKLSGVDNAKSHSVFPRTGAAYKQVFNTWGCQNSGFLSRSCLYQTILIRYWQCWDKSWWSRQYWQMRPLGQQTWGGL